MVLRHFKLREQPFGVTPDPRYLYASATHREALSSLLYGVESGLGFVTLIANPGMGKTTLLFEALRRMQETTRTVFLFQTISTPIDLVRALLIDLGVKDTQGTLVELQTQLNEVLVNQAASGKRLILVIDEAQNLDESVLEAVRMLSNFETARQKLMQIVLSGQLQFAEKLAQPKLLQLRQRISIFAHLKPLSATETSAYIQHRLRVAGGSADEPIFTSSAMTLIAEQSAGIPRNINNICFNALTLGCALQRRTIDADVIREVLVDLDFESISTPAEAAPKRKAKAMRQTAIQQTTSRPTLSKLRAVSVLAAICAIVSLFGWLILQEYRTLSSEGAVHANSNATPAVTVAPAVPIQSLAPIAPIVRSVSGTRPVKVRDGQSLYAICAETYGACRPELLRKIIKINPSISDPNHIESGQKVVLPILLPSAADNK
jgi:type II secretory pathway predicted ATPase ExeA